MADFANEPLAHLLRAARRILAFTGAGISTASGIPDYRGPKGTWTKRRPVEYGAFMSSEAARVDYWDLKIDFEDAFGDARPTAVHDALVRLERAGRLELCVTQNVDGLHLRAGTSRGRLVEIHGTNAEVECQSCGARTDPAPHFELFRRTRRAPLCPCGGYLKPATISFGQALRPEDVRRAELAADRCDLAISLGSTLSVYPAAAIPLRAAERGVPYAVLNQGATDHDGMPLVALRLEGDVQALFPPAVDAALG